MCEEDSDLEQYMKMFVQPTPRYGIKSPGEEWRSVEGSITRDLVMSHLDGKYSIASLGRWYPAFGAIDIDTVPSNGVDSLRASLGLHQSNSMLFTSESEGHYHLLFRPFFREKPPTIRLFQDIMAPYAKVLGVEVYPQKRRTFRLPFGPRQKCVDEGRELLDWRQLLYWYDKLDPFNLESIPKLPITSNITRGALMVNDQTKSDLTAYEMGARLFEQGMAAHTPRTKSQFYVLNYLWQKGLGESQLVELTKAWIRSMHHGYSKQINLGRWREVDADIERQARYIWEKYRPVLSPAVLVQQDAVGWTTREDLLKILVRTRGRLRLARFLYKLLRYMYPRTIFDDQVAIHSDRLTEMSAGSGYLDFLRQLDDLRLIRRGAGYRTNLESKKLTLIWDYDRLSEPYLIEGRTPASFNEALLNAYPVDEILRALRGAGIDSRVISTLRRSLVKRGQVFPETCN